MRLSGSMIQAATGGDWLTSGLGSGLDAVPSSITGVCTDTRAFCDGDAFLALRGPNFDGHAFAESVADRASALIGDHAGISGWRDIASSQLEVEDTLQALGDIAHAWRMQLTDTTVIAISGSYGKTSLRSMLETGFTALGFKVAATRANLNNLVGAPQSLLAVPENADLALIECGISECGEMSRLAAMVQPDIAVLTGITAAHSEGLGGLSGVVREKCLLLNALNTDGWCALGREVAGLMQANHIALPEHAVSVDAADDAVVIWALDGCELTHTYHAQKSRMTLALPARHWAENYAFAASIILRHVERHVEQGGQSFTLADVVSALAGWQPVAGRMQQLAGKNGISVLDDCYNANPVSMQAAIDTLCAMPGRKLAILGDMAELGDTARAAHAGLDIDGIDAIYLIGAHMQALAEKHPDAHWYGSTEIAVAALADVPFLAGDTVLVKASRSMHLESVVALLCSGEVADAL